MKNSQNVKETYVVACYHDEPMTNPYVKKYKDSGKKFQIFASDSSFYTGRKELNDIPMFYSRDDARNMCQPCDRVWKVLANVKTGKIMKWIKKNP